MTEESPLRINSAKNLIWLRTGSAWQSHCECEVCYNFTKLRFPTKIDVFRAVSSAVRALASHARGHWFKSSTAHAEVAEWQTRYVQGVVSVRT